MEWLNTSPPQGEVQDPVLNGLSGSLSMARGNDDYDCSPHTDDLNEIVLWNKRISWYSLNNPRLEFASLLPKLLYHE